MGDGNGILWYLITSIPLNYIDTLYLLQINL